jgi:hypothetical protein
MRRIQCAEAALVAGLGRHPGRQAACEFVVVHMQMQLARRDVDLDQIAGVHQRGSVRPSASAALVIVDAVPIVMQWPGERAMPDSTPSHVAARAQGLAVEAAAQHRPGRHEDEGRA